MINKPKSMLSLEDLVARVERARAAYDWEAVVSLARQALNQEELLPETAYALLDGRAEAHQRLGDLAAEGADLERMARLAGELGDLECQVRVTLRLADLYMRQGHLVEARRVAQSALDEARSIGDRALEAAGLLALSMPHVQESRFAEGRDYAEQAAALFRALGDPVGEAWAVLTSSIANSRQERVVKAAAELRTALELFRSRGHREGEARTLNNMAIAHPDLAQKRTLYEQALAAYDAIGDRRGQAQIYNNLALTNAQMGLYARACEDASEAVETAGRMGARVDLSYYLDTLARGYLGLGDAATAQGLLEEGLALAQETGVVGIQGTYEFALAQVARARGRVADACDLYRTAAGHFASVGIPAEQATCLAWLGAAQLVLGDVEGALASTAQAITLLESIGGAGTEYPPQEIWWCRYRVLTSIPPSPTPTEETRRRDEAWRALDRAREVMLAGVAGLSDDGLRRNYLNKVPTNRQIVGEWLRQAGRRGTSPAPLVGGLTGPGSGQEQFRRMLDIGLRLNARRQAGDLARFVVDQVVELTGAERVALYRQDEAGRRRVAAEFSVEGVTPLSSER
jgi:tetratricopeptide (TPR) repeat protein